MPLQPDSSDPIPQVEPPPPPPPRRPRWWSFRRSWLPLVLTVALASAGTIVTLSNIQERRDLDTEIVSTEKEMKGLRDEVDDQAHEIEALEERAEEALGSGATCTEAAEMGVEVLNALILGLELASQGKDLEAQKEFVDTARLGREADRTTKSCIAGLKGLRDEEAELL